MVRHIEPRVDVTLDVKVWGLDLYGKPFVQHARTVNASTVGARLIGIDCVREGEVISLQHGELKSRCKVIWVGRDAAKARQIGIFCLEPGKPLFGAILQTSRTATGYTPGFAGRKETTRPPIKARSIMQDTPGTRRSQERFHCTGGVELRRNEGAPPVFGNLSDLSLTGCYVETVSTLPVGTELLFMLRVRESVVRGRALVKTSHHAVGVGLVFQHMSKEDRQNLEFVIGSISGSQEMRPIDQRRPVQEDPLPPHRALSGNTVRPASTPASNSPISVQVTSIMTATQPGGAGTGD